MLRLIRFLLLAFFLFEVHIRFEETSILNFDLVHINVSVFVFVSVCVIPLVHINVNCIHIIAHTENNLF